MLIAPYKVNNIPNSSMQECIEYCSKQSKLGLDIETTKKYKPGQYNERVYKGGLDPYLTSVVMIQIGTAERSFVIDSRYEDLSLLIEFLNNYEGLLVGHNLVFEYKHLKYNYDIVLNNCWDTMLCEIILKNGLDLPMGLADLSVRYFGSTKLEDLNLFTEEFTSGDFEEFIYDQVDKHIIDKSTRLGFLTIGDKEFTEKQILYGKEDIEIPLKIQEIQEKGEGDYNPVNAFKLENEYLKVLGDISLNGMYFNPDKWKAKVEKDKPIFNKLKAQLDNWVIKNYPIFTMPIDMFTGKPTCSIMWSSSTQVISLFKKVGFCPKEKSNQTKRLEYSVSNKALSKLIVKENKWKLYADSDFDIIDDQHLIIVYLRYKKYEQAMSTFGNEFLKYVHPITGRLHSSYRQILNTSRISSNKPNLQNIPSDKYSRNCFSVPNGVKLVNCDYSAQEARVIADTNSEITMCEFFNNTDNEWNGDYESIRNNK